ncbi:hypothetical protein [Ornithinimicrobium kibberense]|uniref:hypothetical protein n=1 Tax=Ornithinimicrobium kibberense TaxID=282060 RepID=UPI003611162C
MTELPSASTAWTADTSRHATASAVSPPTVTSSASTSMVPLKLSSWALAAMTSVTHFSRAASRENG